MKISELKVGNESQYVVGFVSDLEEKTTSSGDAYISFKLFDQKEKMDVRIWRTKMDQIVEADIKNGSFVVAKGKCQLFREKKQFSVDSDGKICLRLVTDDDHIDSTEYIPSAPMSPDEIRSFIENTISEIEDSEIRSFVHNIFQDHGEELIRMPASKNVHHDYKNGLGYHITRMLSSATALRSVYKNQVNFDWVIAGVILHDIGKIKCYQTTDIGSPEDYTLENSLIGHIPMGLLLIEPYELEETKKNVIRHLLLSHHGRPEFGAIVPPMFIEAEILHMIDMMDAKITIMEVELDKLQVGEVSDRIWSLDRARILKL